MQFMVSMRKKRVKKSEGVKGDLLRDLAPNILQRGNWTYIFPEKISIGFAREWDIWLNDPQNRVFLSEKYHDLDFDLSGNVLKITKMRDL